MLDDPVKSLEVGRGVIDVMYVEGVLVERDYRRSLMDVDILDAQFFA
jgi:hypothetical protein